MKTWMLRAGAVLMLLTLLTGCSQPNDPTPSVPSDDTTDPTPGIETPTPETPDDGMLTVADFDPSVAYEMPDLSTLNMADYITLGRYRGLTLTLNYDAVTVTDEELDAEIDDLLRNYHPDFKITDRAVGWGDTVVTDYVGTLDGVAFSGGTASGVTITLQDNNGYVPGFVEGLVGAVPGEPHAADVTFPENYHEGLAGEDVVFTFTVHYIQGHPELDDAFTAEHTKGEYTEAAAYREAIRQHMADAAYEATAHSALWKAIAENAAAKQYPADAVMYYYATYYNYYSYYAAMYGVDYDTFLKQYVGGTAEGLFEFCKSLVKEDMVYYAVFADGDYTYTDEQYQRALDLYTAQNYAALEADMIAAGREEFSVEEARDYFDRTYRSRLISQCLEESAYNDLITDAVVVIEGEPEEDSAS